MKTHKVVSLFAGCGGLDLGFTQAGFQTVWANEYDKTIWETYEHNHKGVPLDKRSITDIPSNEIPDADGIIGGPPCQSWSLAGAMRGGNDLRGQLFWEYVRILRDKKPLFFLAENVSGIISSTHKDAFDRLLTNFYSVGYDINYVALNAKHYGVPQERTRVIIVGYLKEIGKRFVFPAITHASLTSKNQLPLKYGTAALHPLRTLRDAIGDLPEPMPAREKNWTNGDLQELPNHEYMTGGFSSIYMSRNRKKEWNEPSFTIQAGGRHTPLHPQSHKMIKLGKDEWKFDDSTECLYRRLSIRECARVQTFPDSFVFKYQRLSDGYKMVGNAVPVLLAKAIAQKILIDLNASEGVVRLASSVNAHS